MSTCRFRRFVPVLACLGPLLAIGAARAQTSGGTSTITFRAVAQDGSPVADLTAGDVSLKIDGKPQELLSLKFVDLRSESAGPAASRVDPPFITNVRTSGGRAVYILVDEESIAPGREALVKEAISALLGALTPSDRAALVSVRQGGPNLGLTRDRTRLQPGIDKLGGYANSRETDADLTCRTSRTLQVIQGLLESAATQELPVVVFFSTQVAALQAGRVGTMATDGRTRVEDLCQLRTEHFQRLGTAASHANATFYSVELFDATASPPSSVASGGLDNLAGSMGGDTIRVGANVGDQMAQVARATAAYYQATYRPASSERSASTRVEIAAARPGITIKAPKGLAPAASARKGGAITPRDMIRVADAFTDFPLRASAYASRNPGDDKIRILALFEPIEEGTTIKSATIVMYDKAGDNKAQWNARSQDLAGSTAVAALLVQPGEYRLRVAATDTTGRAGAVDVDVSAALIEAGPIRLGDLVLGRLEQNTPVPMMQFSTEPEAIAIVELYGRPAGPLKMYVEILNPPGDPIQIPLAPAATNENDKFLLSAALPIGSLKPGDYTVRAIVAVEGAPEGTVTTTLRKIEAGS